MEKIRVLLVDDNILIRDSFIELLKTIPFLNVIGECSDGSEVHDFISRYQVDVIFMDIIMNKMDGFEATEIVKQHFPLIKVIALSPTNTGKALLKMKESGADGFVSKFDSTEEDIISELQKVGFNFLD